MSECPHQFGRVPTAVITSGILARVRPAACRVYLCLCARVNPKWQAQVGVRKLAAETGHQIGTVSEATQQLRKLGLIDAHRSGPGQAYTYTINRKCSAPAEQPTVQHQPNTRREKCSTPTGASVQRAPVIVFSASRTKQSKTEKNRGAARVPGHGVQPALPDIPTPKAHPDGKQPAFTFHTTEGTWTLTEAQRDDLRERYPYCHADSELTGLADWTEANPDKRKKPGAMHQWLRSRLARKQAERPLPSPAYYGDGFAFRSLPTDPTPEELAEILADD